MSTPSDEIARRVAARLAPQIGLTLPAYVERVLAGVAKDDEAVQRTPDAALVLGFAMFVVTVAKLNLDFYFANKPKADALNATELLLFRKQLADNIQGHPQFPAQASSEIRPALVEAVVDETIVEAEKLETKPPVP
jgi:hypothetical protein